MSAIEKAARALHDVLTGDLTGQDLYDALDAATAALGEALDPTGDRRCKECRTVKPVEEYSRNGAGLLGVCKACMSAKHRRAGRNGRPKKKRGQPATTPPIDLDSPEMDHPSSRPPGSPIPMAPPPYRIPEGWRRTA